MTAERRLSREEWSKFVRGVLSAKGWSMRQMAHKLGCSTATVSRWASDDPVRGTIPHAVAKKLLIEIAQKAGLVQ